MPKPKREEASSLSKWERHKLQSLCSQGAAAYGCVRNLWKAESYTKFPLTTRKFKRMKAFARLKDEYWCMDLAVVDKLAKENNNVKFLLIRQDLFDRTVDSKGMKTKDSKETARSFSTMITKRIARKFGLTWGQSLLESSKSFVMLNEYKYTLQ